MVDQGFLGQGFYCGEFFSAMRDVFSCPGQSVCTYDGVSYGSLEHQGASWRFGATAQQWAELLPLTGKEPDAEDLSRLARNGLWLGKTCDPEPLAIMCQGMGALWVGAGRELYDAFPRAREAMDRIAAIASWDVLSLLDCQDLEKITATRWQIPYLFLLEYAQWSYLSSLGLSPSLICGHSLGELIGLCLAGIYTPEIAWHILDTRAEHVAYLEAQATEEFSMLAVHADWVIVEDILVSNPKVRVANYNTPHQFILGGPKPLIREIRSALRKKRIPAVAIAVSMLFHHPAMRVLREHSLLRLNMLAMHAPRIPVLSVCKCQPYPSEQEDICRFIADLDENPVRFSECLASMWHTYGVRSFVELGPQEVLCGLISENLPGAFVASPARKGREARGMRELCALLYAKGRLTQKALAEVIAVYGSHTLVADEARETDVKDAGKEEGNDVRQIHPLFLLLSDLTGVPASEIKPEMDLRKDLALRSSAFPHFLAEAEKRLHITPSFAELVQVATVGDLLRLFSQDGEIAKTAQALPALATRLSPLLSVTRHQGRLVPCCYAHAYVRGARPVLGLFANADLPATHLRILLPDLLLGLPGLVGKIRLAESLAALCQDREFLPLCVDNHVLQSEDCDLFLVLGRLERSEQKVLDERAKPILHLLFEPDNHDPYSSPHERRIYFASHDLRRRFDELGDLLARELAFGKTRESIWCCAADAKEESAYACRALWQNTCGLTLVPLVQPGAFISQRALRIFFDQDADRRLQGQTHVPLALEFLALLSACQAQTPWLDVFGFTDCSVYSSARQMRGVVREGEITIKLLGWLSLSGETRRRVDAGLSLFALTDNGRKRRKQREVLHATVLLGQERSKEPVVPDWVQEAKEMTEKGELLPTPSASPLVSFVNLRASDGYLACDLEPSCIAQPDKIPYIQQLYLFQGAVDAALCFASRGRAKSLPGLSLAKVGFVHLGRSTENVRPRLYVRKTFSDTFRERCDAAVVVDTHPLLLISHMEFVKASV